ncbi:MAG: flagellar FlbD family protein [Oscillospiraceae bacterium]|nr:flagellar FlbD family protein [Oscillospiraceae bacterium]
MITLTKLNGTKFVLNCDLIETIQENPDTTIRLSNGNVYIVKEPSDMVIDLTTEFRRGILSGILNVEK